MAIIAGSPSADLSSDINARSPETVYRLVRISLPRQEGLATTMLRGSFPASQWVVTLRLAYSISKHELFAEISMRVGDTFQLVQRGVIYSHPGFEVYNVTNMQDEIHGEVNVYTGKATLKVAIAYRGKSKDLYEDAHFIAGDYFGIADGVSAWRDRGIDAGLFAREYMSHCQSLFLKPMRKNRKEKGNSKMEKVAEKALLHTQAFGSSTVLLAHIDDRKLSALNIGDSQAAVIRFVDGRLRFVFKTKPQTHSWNTPFQLASLPPHLKHSFINDSVRDSVRYSVDIEPGDLVVMATDGVWDNLFDEEIATIVGEGNHSSPTEIADAITRRAYEKSTSMEATPFGKAYCKDKEGWIFLGGKPDDITVVVAEVSE